MLPAKQANADRATPPSLEFRIWVTFNLTLFVGKLDLTIHEEYVRAGILLTSIGEIRYYSLNIRCG